MFIIDAGGKTVSMYDVLDIGWQFSLYLNSIIINQNSLQKATDACPPPNSNNLITNPFTI